MNKTCGECKYFVTSEYLDVCTVNCETMRTDSPAQLCDYFTQKAPFTNGDKIRQGGNRVLAEIFDDIYNGNKCKYCIHHAGSSSCKLNPTPYSEYNEGYLDDEACLDGFEAWLNALAESDVCVAKKTAKVQSTRIGVAKVSKKARGEE